MVKIPERVKQIWAAFQVIADLLFFHDSLKTDIIPLTLLTPADSSMRLIFVAQSTAYPSRPFEYRQVFETLASYSMLSKGNVWMFTKNDTKGFGAFLKETFGEERLCVEQYSNAGHSRTLFDRALEEPKLRNQTVTRAS